MNKLWLEYFCTIAKFKSITKAAHSLNISQSSLSQTVAKLEQQLGVKLIERVSRGIELTKQGQIFLKYATESLIREKIVRQELLDMGGEPIGDIVIGAYSMSSAIVELFLSFKKSYPKVNITFNQDRLLEQSRDSVYPDLVITGLPVNEEEMDSIDLLSEEFFAVLSKDHPLASRQSIMLEELSSERFIIAGDPERFDNLTNFCAMCGFSPNVWLKCNTLTAIQNVVSSGMAVSVIPSIWVSSSFGKNNGTGVVILPIEYPVCRRTIKLAWYKNRYLSKAAQLFRDYLAENFAEHYHLLEKDNFHFSNAK